MALLKFKRSAVPAKVPSIADLALGELAINTYDGKVYTKKDDGTQAIVEVGGGGGVQTITSSDGSVTVTGTTDIDLSVPVTAATQTVILPVRNNSGATLAKGTAVYINGALGQNPTVTKAIATGDATSAQTLGLVTANIANNAVGNVTLIGSLTNLDTSAYSDGQQLYLSPTTAGALTATKPYAPNHLVYMAVVEHAHPTLGKLFVKVQNGYEMDELHNVAAQSPANNDGLFYNTSTSLWEKKSIATALGYTPANKAGDTFTGTVNVSNANVTVNAGYGLAFVGDQNRIITPDDNVYGALIKWGATGGCRFFESATERMRIDGTGSVTANVDFRAPIFYDSNNTSFYLDPSSTGDALVAAGSGAFGISYSKARITARRDTAGTTPADSASIVLSNRSTAINGTLAGGIFMDTYRDIRDPHYGAGVWFTRNQIAANLSSGSDIVFGAMDSWDSGLPTERMRIYASGPVIATGDIRAPIFYDSNNTGYYADPNGTSNLVGLTVANTISGNITGSANVANYLNGSASSIDVDNIANRVNSGFWQSSSGTSAEGWPLNDGNWQHMISATHSNTGNYFAMQLAAGFFSTGLFYRSVNNSGTQAWSRVALYDNGYAAPLYASIYYDADNTGYYINPNGESVLNTLTLNGELNLSAGTTYVDHSGTIVFRNQNNYVNSATLTTGGDFTASGNVTAYSDIRIKDNVETIPNALDKLDLIRGVTYTRTDRDDKERRYAGVIAQEIEKVLPEAIFENEEYKSVDYNATIGLLIQAIKELRDEVEALKNRG